ncbi:hypothetical protein EOL94_01565 [bacterium]|nr:hypothetical protein [bacterium]
MLWLNFIHLYQPANTKSEYIIEAVENSYKRILRGLQENKNIKFTININGCLIERLLELGYKDLINGFKKLIKEGRVEIVSTAAYHPFLPLLPKTEIIKQIKKQEEVLKKYLDIKKRPRGFFLPEMAYSPEVSKIIHALGYRWIIIDEIARTGKIDETDISKIYKDKNSGLKIIFRSRRQSNTYVPDLLNKNLNKKEEEKIDFFLTATDAELYGLRHKDPTGEFEKTLKIKDIETKTISQYIDEKRKGVIEIRPISCSWESITKELKDNQPYSLWNGKKNRIHNYLWKLANLSLELVENNKKDENYYWARWHLVRGLASCTFWWASAKDFKHNFGPYAWNPDEIERGLEELIRSVRSLENKKTRKDKLQAEKMYIKIKETIWKSHWQHYWKK